MNTAALNTDAVMRLAPTIPVIVIDDAARARALAETLVAANMLALEVTLRTPAALDAIAEMACVPGAVVGAGTVLNEAQLDAAIAAGARFIVSPGLTDRLGGYQTQYEGAADYHLYLRFIHEAPVGITDHVMYLYLDWPGTDSRTQSGRQQEATARIAHGG